MQPISEPKYGPAGTPAGPTTRRQAVDALAERLTGLYDAREARNIARLLVSERAGIPFSALLTDPEAELRIEGMEEDIARLERGVPVQYVIGSAEFYGRRFTVREGVLIPRPETEELVDRIVRSERRGPGATVGEAPGAIRILDVGTGSGCIAATLALEIPGAELFAAEIAEEALDVAEENFRRLGARVTLRRADALTNLAGQFPETFDVIVSNPPYVPASDRKAMHPNVRDHEPAVALFVPDDDPLCFYRAIARAGRRMLRPGGRLWFEIYEHAAEAMCEMLAGEGYTDTEVYRDLFDKMRMTCSRRK